MILYFFYGFISSYVLFYFVNKLTKHNKIYGECPYCRTYTDIVYDEIYECSECKRRYTDAEAYDQNLLNQEADEKEQEYQRQRLHNEQRQEDYKDELAKLNDKYRDIK